LLQAVFYGAEFLAPRPTIEMEDHPLSATRYCLFNTFTVQHSFIHAPLNVFDNWHALGSSSRTGSLNPATLQMGSQSVSQSVSSS